MTPQPEPTPEEARAEQAETTEAIREGLDDVSAGRTRPMREALEEFRREHGLVDRGDTTR